MKTIHFKVRKDLLNIELGQSFRIKSGGLGRVDGDNSIYHR